MNIVLDVPNDSAPAIFATRAELEVLHGRWCDEPELAEDGRCTRLGPLPVAGELRLTRDGDLLAVHPTNAGDRFRARRFGGGPGRMWEELARHHPEARPGGPLVPRYWLLRQAVGFARCVYGLYDLPSGAVLARSPERAEVAAAVTSANRSGCLSRSSVNASHTRA